MKEHQLKGYTPKAFHTLISAESTASLAVVGAGWCGSYHMCFRQVAELEKEFEDKLQIYYIDFDKSTELVNQYGLIKPPAILFFNRGQLRDKLLETTPKAIIRDKIIRLLW